MIETMNYIALIAGILFGFFFIGRQKINWLFIFLNSSPFSSKEGFYDLYDLADDEVSFQWYFGFENKVKKYADYLKLHAEARPTAYEEFRKSYDAITRALIYIVPITIAPAILFWTNWYLYILGVFASLVAITGFGIAKNGLQPGFYQRVVIFTVLDKYVKSKQKS